MNAQSAAAAAASASSSSSSFDVVVIGGGPAGICAAAQAGRLGARTLLVEKSGRLGGTTVQAGIDRPALFHAWGRQVIAGIGWDIVSRSMEIAGIPHPDYADTSLSPFKHTPRVDQTIYAALCDDAVLESGAQLRFHTTLGAIRPAPEGAGWALTLCGKEGLFAVTARVVVDATGDANAVALAGGPLRFPDETQPATLNIGLAGYDPATLDFARLNAAFHAAIARGEVEPWDGAWEEENPRLERYLWWRGHNGNHLHADATARTSAGRSLLETAGRRAVLRMFKFLKTQPGLENLHITYSSPEVGVRETVTIVGDLTITAADYLSGRVWPDAICHAYYPIDLHGSHESHPPLEPGVVPTIPLGALLPRGLRGVIAPGRVLSSDRVANSALRVQAPCMAMGQAAGAAAALAARDHHGELRAVPLDKLRATLRAHGAIVPQTETALRAQIT